MRALVVTYLRSPYARNAITTLLQYEESIESTESTESPSMRNGAPTATKANAITTLLQYEESIESTESTESPSMRNGAPTATKAANTPKHNGTP